MLNIIPIPAFADNYIWLLHDHRHAVVIDPGTAAPVEAALAALGLPLSAILVTHRHQDHVGGISDLQHGSVPVYGPASVTHVTHPVADQEQIDLPGLNINACVLAVPGHTREHLAYRVDQHCFCGDTLFSAGCGRVMDGDAAALYASLQRLAALPDDTLFYPAHEYTQTNLRFALAAEGEHPALLDHLHQARARRAAGQPTVPSPLPTERATNPFLRDTPALRAHLKAARGLDCTDSQSLFIALREWRNQFQG